MPKMNGMDAVVRVMESEGVDVVFGVPGAAILPLYKALSKSAIRHVSVRHEEGGTHAADGYARVTGKVGVNIGTSGPAGTNMITGLYTAVADPIPMICITGQAPTYVLHKEAFQAVDIVEIAKPVTKWAVQVAIDRFHDPAPGAMVRVALAPCSPFSVTRGLMADAAGLARRRGVRLHSHLAETLDEEAFCREQYGMRPVDYLGELGWLGDDVWLAHCVHLNDDEVARFGATGTGVAHCPSSNARLGAAIAPVAALTAAGAPVGLGVDGSASNEAGELAAEVREALLFARLRGGPAALTAREALALGTIEGARCLGRDDELGSLEPGKLADVGLWRLDGLGHAGIADPVAALVLGPPRPVDLLLVGGRAVVDGAELRTADEAEISHDIARASRRLADKVEATL